MKSTTKAVAVICLILSLFVLASLNQAQSPSAPSASPIKSAFTLYGVPGRGQAIGLGSANQVVIYPFVVPYSQQVSSILVRIWIPDATVNSDIGIYDTSGTLITQIGAQAISTATANLFTLTSGTVVLKPGVYFLGFTSQATTLQWVVGTDVDADGGQEKLTWYFTDSVSSGGTVPSTIHVIQAQSTGNDPQLQGFPPVVVLLP